MKKSLTIIAISTSLVTIASSLILGYIYIEDLSKLIYKIKSKVLPNKLPKGETKYEEE